MKKTLLILAALSSFGLASAITPPTAEELAKISIRIDNDANGKLADEGQISVAYAKSDATNQIAISNFDVNDYGATLQATVDWETGDVKIYPQTCGMDYDTYDYLMIVSSAAKNQNPMSIASTYISGKTDGKTITLDAWNVMRVPYDFSENKGTLYATDRTTRLAAPNGTMTYTAEGSDAQAQSVPVYAEVGQTTPATLTVYRWGGATSAVKLVQDEATNTWSVDTAASTAISRKVNYGIYPVENDAALTQAALVSQQQQSASTIEFGPWGFYNAASGAKLAFYQNATLNVDFQLPFSTGINSNVATKAVRSVEYVNLLGERSARPFSGVNIVVTTYTDGTRAAAKQLIR